MERVEYFYETKFCNCYRQEMRNLGQMEWNIEKTNNYFKNLKSENLPDDANPNSEINSAMSYASRMLEGSSRTMFDMSKTMLKKDMEKAYFECINRI